MATVAVIGTGNMGRGLAKVLSEGGHTVILGSRNGERAEAVAREVGLGVVGRENAAAVRDADVCFLAVPFAQENRTLHELREHLAGKIVVDISNPLNASYDGLVTEPTTSAAEWIAGMLPGSRVVGAFKNTLAAVFAQPVFGEEQSTVFVVGDDEEAKQYVLGIIRTLPFVGLDAGPLSVARTLENMSVLLIQLVQKYDYHWRAGFRVLA